MDFDKGIVIVEGPQGVGKTTITNWIREKMAYTNLYRLSGHDRSDADGLAHSISLYDTLMDHIEQVNMNSTMNILTDRSFISELVYCKLGYRQYDFGDAFYQYTRRIDELNNVIIFNLYLGDTQLYVDRLNRDKPQHCDVKFNIENSIKQQDMYEEIMSEISLRFSHICVYDIMTDDRDDWMKQIGQILQNHNLIGSNPRPIQ